MLWLPETFVEKVGAALNLDERQAQMDLERFKSFIEERGRETGGWRGEIHDGVPESEGSSQDAWATGATAGSTVTPGATDDDGSTGYRATEYGSAAGSDMREDDLPRPRIACDLNRRKRTAVPDASGTAVLAVYGRVR